jgi:hypothetical protein
LCDFLYPPITFVFRGPNIVLSTLFPYTQSQRSSLTVQDELFTSGKARYKLILSNPIFLPTAYSPALIYFGRERGRWITCNCPTVLKEKNRETERVQAALSVG